MNCLNELSLPSYPALFPRAATVVGNRGYILDKLDENASGLQSGNGTFTTGPWTVDMHPNFLDTKFRSFFSRLLCRALSGKRRALSTSLESTRSRTCPTERVTFRVRNGYRRVVERGPNMSDCNRHITPRSTLFALGHGVRGSSV